MKKFLTVLLALSVVFTYTVGSAFAAVDLSTVTSTVNKKVEDEYLKIQASGLTWVDNQTYEQPDTGLVVDAAGYKYAKVDGKYFTREDASNLSDMVEAAAYDELKEKAKEIKAGSYDDKDDLIAALDALETITSSYTTTFDTKVKALNLTDYELTYAKGRYADVIENVKVTDYSDIPNKEGIIYRDEVTSLISEYTAKIENAEAPFDTKNSEIGARTLVNEFLGKLALIPTTEKTESEIKDLNDAITYYSAKIESEILAQKAQVQYNLTVALKAAKTAKDDVLVAKIEKAITRVSSDFAAVIEVAKAEISNEATPAAVANRYAAYSGQVVNLVYDSNYEVAGTSNWAEWIDRAETAAALKELAAKMKAETGFNGTPVYDADEVDNALAKDLKLVYAGKADKYLDEVKSKPAEDLVKAEMKRVLWGDDSAKVIVNKVKYDAVAAWAVEANYDAVDNYDEVLAIVKEAKATIRAAKTIADVDAAFLAAYEKFDAVVSDADMLKYQNSTAGRAAMNKYEAKLNAELVGKKADYGKDFDEDFTVGTDFIANLMDKYLKVAYDATDAAAKYEEAVKEITNLKSKAELNAEADAINATILDLSKKTLTSADEAEVLAIAERDQAFTAYKALIDTTGYITYGTTAYVTKMASLVKKDIETAYAAIGTVTVEDEAAIDALAVKVAAYDENYVPASGYAAKVADLYDLLTAAKVDVVEKAIGAIDASAEKLDIAAINAAREAYDALAEDGLDVNPTMYHKLLSLENLAKDYIIKTVESLKIKTSTKLYTKSNKIRVNWKVVDGDASAADGYYVYKSTKAQTGYKFMGKTTKNYMDNKKNLKKGQRYFYKVKAYVEIDGVKYFSDDSNKGNRIYK